MADWLCVPRSSVEIASGATARLKTIRIAGDPAELGERIGQLTARLAAGAS